MLVGILERAGRAAGARGREPLSLVLTFSTRGCWWCKGPWGQGVAPPSEGLVVVAVGRPVAEHLAGVAVGPLLAPAAVVGRVWRLLQRLRLRRAVLGVVQVEAAADVAEETGLLLGQALLLTVIVIYLLFIAIEGCFTHSLYLQVQFFVSSLQIHYH